MSCRERDTGEVAAAKYLRQEKSKVRREAQILRSLIQSAFVVRLAGLYESSLNSVLVTEYLAGGDLVTRTAPEDYNLTERKCQIFIRQVGLSHYTALPPNQYTIISRSCAVSTSSTARASSTWT